MRKKCRWKKRRTRKSRRKRNMKRNSSRNVKRKAKRNGKKKRQKRAKSVCCVKTFKREIKIIITHLSLFPLWRLSLCQGIPRMVGPWRAYPNGGEESSGP